MEVVRNMKFNTRNTIIINVNTDTLFDGIADADLYDQDWSADNYLDLIEAQLSLRFPEFILILEHSHSNSVYSTLHDVPSIIERYKDCDGIEDQQDGIDIELLLEAEVLSYLDLIQEDVFDNRFNEWAVELSYECEHC